MFNKLAALLAVISTFLVFQPVAMADDCLVDLRAQLEPVISSKVPTTFGVQTIFNGALSADVAHQYVAFVTMSIEWTKGCDSKKNSTTRAMHIWVRDTPASPWVAKGSLEMWPVDTYGGVSTLVSTRNNVMTINQQSRLNCDSFFDSKKLRYLNGRFQVIGWDHGDHYAENGCGRYTKELEKVYDDAVKRNPKKAISEATGYKASANYLTGNGWLERFVYAESPVKKHFTFSSKPLYLNELKNYPFPIN